MMSWDAAEDATPMPACLRNLHKEQSLQTADTGHRTSQRKQPSTLPQRETFPKTINVLAVSIVNITEFKVTKEMYFWVH